jgi:hypothetical protein
VSALVVKLIGACSAPINFTTNALTNSSQEPLPMQQQQHADYDLLAVFTDEAKADEVASKLHKEGFTDDEVYQLAEGNVGLGQFREHGPSQSRSEFFLQTQRSGPNPVLIVLFAVIFGALLGVLTFAASFALPTLPEPVTIIIAVIVGIALGAIFGSFRRRTRGAIGQQQTAARPNAPPAPPAATGGVRNVIALRFSDPENISRNSRARAILLNNKGKIDRSVRRREA